MSAHFLFYETAILALHLWKGNFMAKITLGFAFLLFVLSAGGYAWKDNLHTAALVPAVFGLLLAVFGTLSLLTKGRNPILAHAGSVVGIIGLLASALLALNGYGMARSEGVDVDKVLLEYRLATAAVLLVYVNFGIHAFMNAHAARQKLD